MNIFKFLRTTSLWIILLPLALSIGGAASNQLVLIANHDTFPVNVNRVKINAFLEPEEDGTPGTTIKLPDGTEMIDDLHCVMTSKTHLNFLADEFDLRNIYSVGDFMLMLASWLWTFVFYVWGFAVVDKLRKLQS